MNELQITLRPTLGDIVWANVEASRGHPIFTVFATYLIAMSVLGLIFGAPILALLPPIALAAVFWSGLFAAPFAWFVVRTRKDLVLAETSMRFTEEGIQISSALFNGTQAWSTYRRARETANTFYLEAATGIGSMVIKRGLADADQDRLRTLLAIRGLLRESTSDERLRAYSWPLLGVLLALGQLVLQGQL